MTDQIVFGLHAVKTRLRKGVKSSARVLVQQGKENARIREVVSLARTNGHIVVEAVDVSELASLSGDGNHQGIMLILTQTALSAGEEPDLFGLIEAAGPQALVLVLDGVTDPRNLGACIRSAAAFGATAVVAPRDGSASITPVARKVASGGAEQVPFLQVTNLARTMDQMKKAGLWTVGMALEGSESLTSVNLDLPLAIVLGSEDRGLRRKTREHCDYLAAVPMVSTDQSLNVSVAAGIALFEAVRQRGFGP